MLTESIVAKGSLNIKLLDKNNILKDERDIKNLVVATGKDFIVSRMAGNTTALMSHMAVGTGNVSPATGNTGLIGEIARTTLTSTSVTNNTITFVSSFGDGEAVGTLAEAGIFNNATANTGTMLCRTRFNEVNKATTDVIVITWNITVE